MARCLLYYITDRAQFAGDESTRREQLLAKIAEAARAGVDLIQLREKDLTAGEFELLAKKAVGTLQKLRTENRELRTILLINSRTDIALASCADGVHLRSDDISPSDLRSIWSSYHADNATREPLPMIGVSCHSTSDVVRAKSEGADFAVFAPVFEKSDRPGGQPAGFAALREACLAKIPVFALGGVTLQNAVSCIDAGAAGVAGIRLFQQNRIDDVARVLRR